MKPEIRWPLLVVGLLSAQVLLGLFFVWRASSDPSFAVEEDYYKKAMAWDKKMAQDRINSELGWQTEIAVEAASAAWESPTLTVSVIDHRGHPVESAKLTVETFHNTRAGDILRATLSETAPGLYRGKLDMRRPGLWEVRVRATRGTDVFTHRDRLFVAGLRR